MRMKPSIAFLSILAFFGVVVVRTSTASALPSVTPVMVKDIGTGNGGSDDLTLLADRSLFVDGDTAYFSARSDGGDGLWKSDGTEAGTVLVASATNLGGVSPYRFVKAGSSIYFTVSDMTAGTQIVKKYDGSSVTTVADSTTIYNVLGGASNLNYYGVDLNSGLWSAGGDVYFVGSHYAGTVKHDLFRYHAGAVQRVTTDNWEGNASYYGPVFALNGTTYFWSYVLNVDESTSSVFRRVVEGSPVSVGSPVLLDNINGIAYDSPNQGQVIVLPGSPDRAYMQMYGFDGSSSRYSIIEFDGTTAAVVTDGTARIQYAGLPTRVGNRVYFYGLDNTPAQNSAIWYTSAVSATMVNSGSVYDNVTGVNESGMQGSLNDSLYLFHMSKRISGSTYHTELWRSDGTAGGTYLLADTYINPNYYRGWLYAAQGVAYFSSASAASANSRVRATDGTVAGTSDVYQPDPDVTVPGRFTQGISKVFFIAQTSGYGMELHTIVAGGGGSSSTSPTTDPSSTSTSTSTPPSSTTTVASGNTSSPTTTIGRTGSAASVPTDDEINAFDPASLVPGGTARAGASLTIEADGFTPSETVNAILKGSSKSLGKGKASSVGKASVSIKVPSNVSGKKTLVLYGSTSRKGVRQTITITKSASVMPTTGGTPQPYVWFSAALIMIGLVVRRVRRQRISIEG